VVLFGRVFRQAEGRYRFTVRGLRVNDDWLTFYILPADGFELPDIMKWLKQVFAQRFNGMDGRIGHIWGDRYWSEILEGEPPEEETAGVRPLGGEAAEEENTGVRPLGREAAETGWFPLIFLPNPPLPPHFAIPRPG
jgi:hypothetical protein